jgi:hypothetical protein
VTQLLPLVLLAQLAGVAGVDVSDNHEIDFARPTVSVLVGAEYVAPRWEAALMAMPRGRGNRSWLQGRRTAPA